GFPPMQIAISSRTRIVALMGGLCLLVPAVRGLADEPAVKSKDAKAKATADIPEISLFEAVRQGQVSATAEGSGDGRMTLSLTNRTNRQLKGVLPPGRIAAGVTGRMGGMGGMGGGMMGGGGGGG